MLIAGSGGGSGSDSGSGSGSGSESTISKIIVKDVNDQSIGYLIEWGMEDMKIMTSKGFVFTIAHNGNFTNFRAQTYKDSADAQGSVNVGIYLEASSISSKILLFTSTEMNDDNFDNFQICGRVGASTSHILDTVSDLNYLSKDNYVDGLTVETGTIEDVYILDDCWATGDEVFRSQIGFPENAIEPPFSFTFGE